MPSNVCLHYVYYELSGINEMGWIVPITENMPKALNIVLTILSFVWPNSGKNWKKIHFSLFILVFLLQSISIQF